MHFAFFNFLGANSAGGLVAAAVAAFFCAHGNGEREVAWEPMRRGSVGWCSH